MSRFVERKENALTYSRHKSNRGEGRFGYLRLFGNVE